MAKIEQGYMGGFVGKLGPAVGYHWRGKWCVRALPRTVHNPRTAAQQAHRMQFREMVQLAGRFRAAINTGLHRLAYEHGMTECNMFVRRNHRLLTSEGLDYRQLELSHGPVAPVGFGRAQVDEGMVLRVEFEKNPLRVRADGEDEVVLFVYCVDLQVGIRSRAVSRKSGRIEVALPDEWAGTEMHVYGFVVDRQGRTSRTIYVEVGGRKSEVGGRGSEVGGRKSEVGGRTSEVGSRGAEVGSSGSEVGGWKSERGEWETVEKLE